MNALSRALNFFAYAGMLTTLMRSAQAQTIKRRSLHSIGRGFFAIARPAGLPRSLAALVTIWVLAAGSVASAQQTVVANYNGANLVILDLVTGNRTVLSSSTVGTGTIFSLPVGMTREASGSILVGENSTNARIFRIDATTGNRTILSGGSPSTVGTGSAISDIYGLAVEADGSVLAASNGTTEIVRINSSTGNRTVVTSAAVGSGATMRTPFGLLVDTDNSIVFTAWIGANEVIRVNPTTGARTLVSSSTAGNLVGSGAALVTPTGVVRMSNGSFAVLNRSGTDYVLGIDPATGNRTVISSSTVGTGSTLSDLRYGLAIDSNGNLYVADSSGNTVVKIDPATGNRTTIASNTLGTGQAFNFPLGMLSGAVGSLSTPVPAVTAITPTSGSTAGGTSVAITGTNLTGATAVKFGTTDATTFTVNGATSITATSPAGSAGVFDIKVTTAGGTSAAVAADQFTYTAGATVPGAPTGVTATAGNAQATVTFTAPASNGGSAITGYTVTSNPAGGTDSNAGTTGLSHVITGLTNGTSYTFTVTATNTAGTGSASSPSTAVTPQGPIPVVTNSTLTASGTYNSAFTTYTITASNTPTSFSATGLPTGLSLDTSTGAITGTPTQTGSFSVTIGAINAAGTGTATLTITVVGPPVITTAPATQTVASGASVSFSATATGTTPFTYQWYKNGSAISGATAASYAIASAQLADAANYSVAITNSIGTAISNVGVLTVNAGPAIASISAQTGRVIPFGGSATLTAGATGSGSFSYQWFKNSVALSGQTGAALTLTNVQAADAADYTVQITNGVGTITSTTISVIVATVGSGSGPITIATNTGTQVTGNVDATTGVLAGSVTTGGTLVAPRIAGVTSGSGLLVELGSTATLAISASGNPAPTFQWYKDGAVLTGQTASTLTLSNAQTGDAGLYSVVVSNSGGSVSSERLGVTVAQLGNRTGPVVIATSGGTQISGAIDGPSGVLTGSVTVNATTGTIAPKIDGIASAAGLLLNQGASAVLTASASGNPTPAYQWLLNGAVLAGQTASTLNLVNVQPTDAGSYSVRATNASGTVTSSTIPVTVIQLSAGAGPVAIAGGNGTTVNATLDGVGGLTGGVTTAAVTAPKIAGINNQTDLLIKIGATATLTGAATGAPTPAYQWFKDGVALAGQTAASLTLANAQVANAGSYVVTATNSAGSATSAPIGVTVAQFGSGGGPVTIATSGGTQVAGAVDASGILTGSVISGASGPVAPRIGAISSGTGLLLNQGDAATLNVSASGSPAPSFQWLRNGVKLAGQTSASLALTNVQPADAGSYTVTATNAGGSATSKGIPVTVVQLGAGSGPVAIAGGNGTFVNATVDDAGGLSGSVTTAQPGAIVAPQVAGVSSKADLFVQIGESATLTAFASGNPAPAYQWFRNGKLLPGQIQPSLILANAQSVDAGNYTVTATNSAGSVTSAALGVTVGRIGGSGGVSVATSGGTQVAATIGANGALTGSLTLNAADTPQAPSATVLSSTPGNLLVQRGGTATLTVTALGTPAPAYQWLRNGTPLANETASTLVLANAQPAGAGLYTVRVTNATGSVLSAPVAVSVGNIGADGSVDVSTSGGTIITAAVNPANGVLTGGINTGGAGTSQAPRITAVTSNPTSVAAQVGATANLTVVASGNPLPTIQWFKNGVALTGRTDSTLTLGNIRLSDAGNYSALLTNATGSTLSSGIEVTVYSSGANGALSASTAAGASVNGAVDPTTGAFQGTVVGGVLPVAVTGSRLINLSTRTKLAPGSSVSAGFIITGTTARQLLVRAVGPGLVPFGLTGALPSPRLQILRGSIIVASNAGVGQSGVVGDIADASRRSGAFPLAASGTDAAVLTTLDPGTYTVEVTDSAGAGGDVLVEIYDPSALSASVRLSNCSTRVSIAAGDRCFAGLAIAGSGGKRVLIRAVGPTLASSFGIAGAMPAPVLRITQGGTLIVENRGWTTSPDAAQIPAAALQAGAFTLRAGSADAAALPTLQPGNYDVQVFDANGAPGTALIEIYEVP